MATIKSEFDYILEARSLLASALINKFGVQELDIMNKDGTVKTLGLWKVKSDGLTKDYLKRLHDWTVLVTGTNVHTDGSLLFKDDGSGDEVGTSFNGSVDKTISYNSIGAAPNVLFTDSINGLVPHLINIEGGSSNNTEKLSSTTKNSVFLLGSDAKWYDWSALSLADHTYTFSHDDYITLTTTNETNNSTNVDLGINTSELRKTLLSLWDIVESKATFSIDTAWTDSGIDLSGLSTGSYLINIDYSNLIFTGTFSVLKGNNTISEEIPLHMCGDSSSLNRGHIYARIYVTPDYKLQLQISTEVPELNISKFDIRIKALGIL